MPYYVQDEYRPMYQDKGYLQEKFIQNKLSAKQIAKENNVSYKLINLWLIESGLLIRTPETQVP